MAKGEETDARGHGGERREGEMDRGTKREEGGQAGGRKTVCMGDPKDKTEQR